MSFRIDKASGTKIECLYYSTTLGLKFKFRNDGADDDTESRTSVIVLDNNAIAEGQSVKNKPFPATPILPRPANRLTKEAISSISSKRNSSRSSSPSKSLDGGSDVGDESTNPFSTPTANFKSKSDSSQTKSPKDESNITKVTLECDELFGAGVKRLLKLEASLFSADQFGMDQFVDRLVQCLKAYSIESSVLDEETAALYQILWESLADIHTLSELSKFLTVSYYDVDVEEFVVLIDNEAWQEFLVEPKKRVKVILRTSVLNGIAKGLAAVKEIGKENDISDSNLNQEIKEIILDDELNVLGTVAPEEEDPNWLQSAEYDDKAEPFLIADDNEEDVVEVLSEDDNNDVGGHPLTRMDSHSYHLECKGTHWLKSPAHVPPLGAIVVSVNGVNIGNLDRDFQLALLKQRKRPLYLTFQVPSSDESKDKNTDQENNDKQRVIIPFSSIQSKYAYSSMSKIRKVVDGIMKEYIGCDWLTAMDNKTGTPQATIISLYKYIESEMLKLGLLSIKNEISPKKSQDSKGQPEVLSDDVKDQIAGHIETLLFQRISEHTLHRIAIPYIQKQRSIEQAESGISASTKLEASMTFSKKMSFLRFVTPTQLGLQGISGEGITSDQIVAREEWRLAMKGLCRAIQFPTPGTILSKIVITIRLIIQALDALLNRPSVTNVDLVCQYSKDPENPHHHVDNIMSEEEFEALKLLISSHEKYPSATSTDVLMLQKTSDSPALSSTTSHDLSADELLPAIAWTVIQANPDDIEEVLWICSEFRHPQLLRGEEAYCLAQLTSAVEFLRRLDHSMLDISYDAYFQAYQNYLNTQELFAHCKSGSSIKVIGPLIDQGADINSLTPDQSDTPLTLCIRNEHHHLVSYFIKLPTLNINRPISPCTGQYQNSTALIEAVRYNQIATVLKLLKYGANRYHADDSGSTALSVAMDNNYTDIVIVLQADPYRVNYLDAVETEEVDLIRGLLLQGVDVNMFLYDPSTAGTTAAEAALSSDTSPSDICIDLMLTPLMAATGCPNLSVVRSILDAEEVNVSITNPSDPYLDSAFTYLLKRCCGYVPAQFIVKPITDHESDEENVHEDTFKDVYGCQSFHVYILAMLIQAGASKDTPVTIDAVRGISLPPIQLVAKHLQELGLSLNPFDSFQPTPQISNYPSETESPSKKSVKESDLPTAIPDSIISHYQTSQEYSKLTSTSTPIMDVYHLLLYSPGTYEIYNLAREKNHIGVLSLLRQGGDVNKADPERGYTALIAATFNQDYLMVELLLSSSEIISSFSPIPNQTPENVYTTVREGLKPPTFLDINQPGRGGMRALHYAAQIGDIKIVARLLKSNADRYLRNKKGLTAFDVALMNGHTEAGSLLRYDPRQVSIAIAAKHGDWGVIRALLSQGVSANVPSAEQSPELYTPLIAAVAHGQHEIVRQLLSQITDLDVNIANHENQTALMFAASRGDESIVLKLLKRGADRWVVDNKGKTAADLAFANHHELVGILLSNDPKRVFVHDIIRKGDFSAVVALFKQGVDINLQRYEYSPQSGLKPSIEQPLNGKSKDPYLPVSTPPSKESNNDQFISGETPLCIACYYGRHDVTRLLLKAPGIQVNLCDGQGWTPLHYAAYMNYEDLVIRLLQAKCNRRSYDLVGRTPVDIAIERGYLVIASLIEADPYFVHIHDVAASGKLLLVLALLKQGCPPTYCDERQGHGHQTPLMAASRGGQGEIVRMLLRYKEVMEEIDVQDDDGLTALMHAAKVGALDVTALLLNAGCDRELKDNKGLTARDHAAAHSFTSMFQFMSQTIIR